jgi:hypothetical protein
MKRVFIMIMMASCLLGCSRHAKLNPQLYPHNVMIDLHHGSLDPTLKAAIERRGFQLQTTDLPVTYDVLQSTGILWIADDARRDYRPDEIKAIKAFVRDGGTLICAGQAWSWVGDKNDIAKYPLNELGKKLGFRITGQNIGMPGPKEPSAFLLGVESINHTDWWPSMVESDVAGAQVIIRDESMKAMAVYIPSGKGQILVFGHAALLRDNPRILLNILNG